MKSLGSQVKTIDCLRGVAALMVCFYHFVCGNGAYLPEDNILKIIGRHGYLGIEIFFIISGFILPYSMEKNNYTLKNYWKFISKRILRLDPPYITVIILTLILGYIGTLLPSYRGLPVQIDVVQIALHLGYITAIFDKDWINPVFWTLALEFQFYLILALIYPIISKTKHHMYFLTMCCLLFSYFSDNEAYILKFLPFFSLGINFFFFYTSKLKLPEFILIIVCIYSFILLKFNISYLISSLVPLIIFYNDQISNKTLLFLGKISYSIYLLHVPIGMKIINFSEPKVANINWRGMIVFVDLMLLVVVSYFFYKFIELPAIKLSKKIKYFDNNG